MTEGLVLDASVWLAALDGDDTYHGAAKLIIEESAKGNTELAALDLTLYEITNVAVVRWRSQEDAKRLVELLEAACPRTLEPVGGGLLQDAGKIASEHAISVYDAAYVACARRRNATLVSGDLTDLVKPGLAINPGVAAEALRPQDETEDRESG